MSWFVGIVRSRWRYTVLPLAAWMLLVASSGAALTWLAHDSRSEFEERFRLRTAIAAEFVATHVGDLLRREREQATEFLAGPTVAADAFARSTAAFGYSAAVLLDSTGRLLHVAPAAPDLLGRDLTVTYPHLRTAVQDNRPAVSPVVRSAATGAAVVAFATPYRTPYGRRVFSGAVDVAASPLGSYLGHAIALPGSSVYLFDTNGTIVGTGSPTAGPTGSLAQHQPDLAAALRDQANGRVTIAGEPRYFASEPVPNTPWRLAATVAQSLLYHPVHRVTTGVQAAGVTVAGLGLFGVAYAGRIRRSRADLLASEQRFRGLFENTMVGMVFTAVDGRFLTVNQALCQMVGYSATELENGSWQRLTHPDDTAASARQVDAVLAGAQRGFTLAKRYVHADGRVIHVEVTSTLLRDERGRPLHFVTQIVDVSDRHRLQEQREQARQALAEQTAQLKRSNAELQDANRRIADLVTMLTHDVRQPLSSIAGYCDLLLEGWQDSSEADKWADLRRLAAAGRAANELVEEVLTLTQLDADAARPSATPIRLRTALDEAVDVLPADHRAGLEVDVPPDHAVLADPRHLHQILVNLLSNAYKYGSAPVRLSSARLGGTVQMSVSDSGEGVPEEFVPHLFERFARANTGVAPKRKGTGVGLYIVRQLAEANGGSVTYQPNQPHGSRFLVRLPAP